ncbi:MAG TPA: alpha/beta hydrolase-fold protein [Anaerolineales bacterium]|jgi:enterochelin esterase family protein
MDLYKSARENGNPVIEGNKVTFVWEGKRAPVFISDLHGWEDNPRPFTRAKKDLWTISFELALDAYLEYAFIDPATKKRFPDPLNRKSVYNGVGAYNHYFYMPEAHPTGFTGLPDTGLRGKLTRHTVPAMHLTTSDTRRVYLYHPPVDQAVPLLVVYDGLDYFRRGHLVEIVDNMIAARRIQPVGLAFCQNAGKGRMVEYGCSDTTLAFLTSRVLPLAAGEMKLLDHAKTPGVHGILGASMGGLMSVYTALRLPQVFGKALSQAGAFELGEHESIVTQMVRHFPRPTVKLWLDCGQMDFLLACNRKLSGLLAEKSYDFTYHENGGAHNYTTWRDSLVFGLEALF